MARPRKGGERYDCGKLKPKRLASLGRPDPPKLKRQPSSDEPRLEEWERMRFFHKAGWREERERHVRAQQQAAQEGGGDIRAWRATDDNTKA